MQTDFSISIINNESIEMYIVPANARHIDDDQFILEDLNFTWKAVSYEESKLKMNLYFNNPLAISPL